MAAITKTDLSVTSGGDVRHVTGTTTHTVLELHRWLMSLLGTQVATDDDYIDVTNEIIPSTRLTDKEIVLNAPYNIDDRLAERLYGGSIKQAGGDTIYSGLSVIASFNDASTEPQIIQDNKIIRNFWGTGINPDTAAGVIMRILVKSRDGGSDIDNKKIRVQNKEWGDTWGSFPVTLSTGEQVAAISGLQDDFNQSLISTIEGYTDIINNLEGYQQIDLGDGSGNHEYISEWDKGTRTLNDLYERAKWIGKRALAEDEHTGTGKDNPIGNGSIVRQAQSFTVGSNAMNLTRIRVRLKKTGTPSGNITATLYEHSGTYGTSSVGTGSALATSENVSCDLVDTTYREIEFNFNGSQQVSLTASTNYVIAIEYSGGDASNYLSIDGVDTSGHDGNRCDYVSSWTADSSDDLYFKLFTSWNIYGMSGELFRGITHQIPYDTASGNFTQNEILSWGTDATAGTGALLGDDDNGTSGTFWIQLLTGIAPTDGMTMTGGTSAETADVNGTVTSRNLSPNNVFLGTYTGSLTTAYGEGVESADLTNSDKLRDLTDTVRTPPNNVNSTFNALVSGDIVFAAQTWTDTHTVSGTYSAGDTAITLDSSVDTDMPQPGRITINGTEYTYSSYSGAVVTLTGTGLGESLSGGETANLTAWRTKQYTSTGNTSTQTYIEINEAIETFDRTAGYIRIWNSTTNKFDRYKYDSYDTGTKRYTLNTTAHPSGLSADYTDSDPIFVPIADEATTATQLQTTHIYSSDVTARLRVYDAGEPIQPFEVPFTVTSGGATVQAIRNADA